MFYSMVGIWKVALAALFKMLGTSRSCGNSCCFGQNFQPGKINFQDSVLIIKCLVAVSFGYCNMCCISGLNCCLEEIKIDKVVWICGKRTHHLKRELLILGKNFSN